MYTAHGTVEPVQEECRGATESLSVSLLTFFVIDLQTLPAQEAVSARKIDLPNPVILLVLWLVPILALDLNVIVGIYCVYVRVLYTL